MKVCNLPVFSHTHRTLRIIFSVILKTTETDKNGGSYMSALELLNLLNKMGGKEIKCKSVPCMVLLFNF